MFGGMRIYTVHINPDELSASQKPIFIREGFNIYAFLLGGFWALYHRLWRILALILAVNGALIIAGEQHVVSAISISIIQLGVNVFIGLQANDWLRMGLSRRGYILADIAVSDSLLRAEQRYFERYLAA